jgi:hypothetical protein
MEEYRFLISVLREAAMHNPDVIKIIIAPIIGFIVYFAVLFAVSFYERRKGKNIL